MTKRVFIFGAGYSGRAFAREIAGKVASLAGTTRGEGKRKALADAGIAPLLFDGEHLAPDVAEALKPVTHLVVSIGPREGGDPVLACARGVIAGKMPALRWIAYLSTVGVYGDHGGAWVNEDSECRPVSERSLARLAAELDWLALGKEAGVPVAVLRLSGIYGPGRNAFVNLQRGTARRIVKPGQVFNRVHADDIAGALAHLMGRDAGGIFNVTDDVPAPPQDVVAHAARLMGVEPPPEVPFEEAGLGPMARSFYGECKRVSNARLKAEGYIPRHPDYRAALDEMWADGSWKQGVNSE